MDHESVSKAIERTETMTAIADEWANRMLNDERITGFISKNLRGRPPSVALSDCLYEWLDDHCHVNPLDT